jgi:hypothetical protein
MRANPDPVPPPTSWWRVLGLALYYLAILIAIIVLHGRGGLETPKFIYQGF